MKITAKQAQQLRGGSRTAWKYQIVEYLLANDNKADQIKLYNDTRPDRLDISDAKKVHNLASQYKYLRDENYIIEPVDGTTHLMAKPVRDEKGKLTNEVEVFKGYEKEVKSRLGL